MDFIVDTNVLIVANGNVSPQASSQCVQNCVAYLRDIQQNNRICLDDQWLIIKEYMKNVSSTGQPGVGDAFFKWILTNQGNSERCYFVPITSLGENTFKEFPQDSPLANFDPSDRKFVVVALVHPEKPPILNAVDSDWKDYHQILASFGIIVKFLCEETAPS
ncbi:MAG: hypothetical protein ACRCT1_16145 [Microcoleaceae cyanobacterium]